MAQNNTLGRNIEFPIMNSDGTPFHALVLHKATYESTIMSLGDKVTGDVFYKDNTLAVTMQEYIIVDGVKYMLVSPPTIVREGMVSDNTQLKGMTKYSFTFYHPMYMLGNFPFTDIAVTQDEEKYLSQNKTFSWIGSLSDFVDKLNANLASTEWIVVVSSSVSQEKQNEIPDDVLSFDKQFISDALKAGYDTWKIPFVITPTAQVVNGVTKKFKIEFGLPSQEIYTIDAQGERTSTPFVFQFGKGVGLKNNSRTPRNNKIVTRIVGSGSERNVPFGYPQIVWTGNQQWDYTINNNPNATNSYPIYDGIVGGQKVRLIKHPFTRTTLMPSVYSETVNKKVNPNATGYNPDIEIKDYYDAIDDETHEYPNNINLLSPSVELHQFEDIYPRLINQEFVSVSPYDGEIELISKTVYNTRIQTFKNQSANYNEKSALQDAYDKLALVDSITHTGGSYTYEYKRLKTQAYQYGTWYHVKYTSGNINYEYYVWDGTQAPQIDIVWDDTMNDDGEYVQSYFKMKLPVLNFDLYASAAVTQEMKINMRSGQCLGCTFPVQVDWDDYKANFYDADGNFDPVIGSGHPRNGDKYPDSSQSQITIVVQKETETFGTLMPNIYQQPASGDNFVILGISLPTSYITDAEDELDEAMKEYMLENNVHYYDYPLKFDEYFLATNTGILEQIQNNNIVRFQYAGAQMALYIKQITIKYGEKPLPQYDITLTDDVEIVLNQIGQVTDDVSRMRVQLSELQKYYSENLIQEINNKLSRIQDDVCQGRITFQQGLDAICSVIFHDEVRSPQFESGLYTGRGWRIDNLGNAEFESARVRSYFEVVELLVNRLQAQEGDTLFTDNDQIDRVDPVYEQATPEQGDNPKANKWYERTSVNNEYVYTPTNDTQVDQQKTYYYISSYILSLKEKYQGYITGQMYGNVVKGIINTLAAKQAGVSDVQDSQTVEIDGSNTYYTSWMQVIGTHNTNNTDNSLGVNQIKVVLYGDDYYDEGYEGNPDHLHHITPAGKNFEPCELMTIARWGCVDYSDSEDPDYETIKASIIRRQRMFMISTTDGRVVKYTGVDSPILKNGNYGVTIGELPEFVKNYPDVRAILNQVGEHTDWLYAQGVVVGKFIKVDIEGNQEPNIIDCGNWVNGANVVSPTPRNGVYLYNEWNSQTQQYETHDVWHNNAKWRCKMTQPVVSGGVAHYYEPTDANSAYWQKLASGGQDGEDGNSVIIAGYADYYDGEDWQGNAKPKTVTETEVGQIDLLDYHSAQEDMIAVGEEGLSDWQWYSIPVGTCYILRGSYHLYEATENGWLDLGRFKGENGEDGTSPFIADLDNEMDSVACDVNGKPSSTQTVSTKVNLYYGTSKRYFTVEVFKNAACTQAYTNNPTLSNGIAVWWNSSSLQENTINVKVSNALTIDGKITLYIRLTDSTDNNIKRILTFTINGVRPGENGEPATIYNLMPSVNAISFGEGSSAQTVYMELLKTEGESSSTISMNYPPNDIEVHYSTNTVPDESNPQTQWGTIEQGVRGISFGGTANNTATIQPNVEFNKIYLALFKTAGSGNNKTYTLIDRETIPIVKDGKNAFVVDLENEMTNVALDEDGKLTSALDMYFKVRAYYGTQNVLDDCTVTATCSNANINVNTNAATTSGNGIRLTANSGISVNNTTDVTVTVVHATYGTRVVVFTLAGVRGGENAVLQELLPSLDAISFARTAAGGLTPNSRSLSLSIKKTQGGTTSTQTTSASRLTIKWAINSMPTTSQSGYTWENGSETGISWSGTTMQIANTVAATNIYIAAFNSGGTLVDRETIPIIKDGNNGADGEDGEDAHEVNPNILLRTIFDKGIDFVKEKWGGNYSYISIDTSSDTVIEGRKCVRINASSLPSLNYIDFSQNVYSRIKPNTWYTLSFNYFATEQFTTYIYDGYNTSGVVDQNAGFYIDGTFVSGIGIDGNHSWPSNWNGLRHTLTFKTKSSFGTSEAIIIFRVFGGSQLAICMPKLETGDAATAYMAHEEDLKGTDGARGKIGRFFYYAQEWSNNPNVSYDVTDAEAPYFKYNDNYWVFNPTNNGTYTMSAMGEPSSSNENWELMVTDFKYIITEAIFGNYAHFGSFIINGDWMISQHGKVNGETTNSNAAVSGTTIASTGNTSFTVKAYTIFDNESPTGESDLLAQGTNESISPSASVVSIASVPLNNFYTYCLKCKGHRNSSSYPVYLRIRNSNPNCSWQAITLPTGSDSELSVYFRVAESSANYVVDLYQHTTGGGASVTEWSISRIKFAPNFAVDGLTGKTYQNDAYIKGVVEAVDGVFNGELTAGDMKVTRRQESNHVWSGMYTPSLSEAVSIGVRNYSNNSYSGEIILLGSGKAGGYVSAYAGGDTTGSKFELSHSKPVGTGNRSRIVLASGDESGKASITVQTTVASGGSATVITPTDVSTPTVEATTARATDVYASNIRASAGYRIPTTDPSLKTISSTTTISDSACQMIIVTGNSDITITLTSTPETGKLMIIKKTTNSGWVTVKNSSGTQIGFFNCGSIVCVYNSGWK